MILEEVLPALKSGAVVSRRPWLVEVPQYFIQRKGLENAMLIDSSGYQYSLNIADVFADDWVVGPYNIS